MSETLPVTGSASLVVTAVGAGLVAVGQMFVRLGRRMALR